MPALYRRGGPRALARAVVLAALAAGALRAGDYLVLLDPGKEDEFRKAAEALAALHSAEVRGFSPDRLDEALAGLRKAPPRFVAFVLPPEKIDVDLAHAVLEMSTRVDEDPFPDFEYGFVTGRDGEAAARFVARIAEAWKRDFGRKGALLGTWGGTPPLFKFLTATRTLGLDFQACLVNMGEAREDQAKRVRGALESFHGLDALLFFSHGWPDQMAGCFRAQELRDWKVDLAPAVLFNCACFNGAPGRSYALGPAGIQDLGVVRREDSVALALLDSGISAYFAGIDSWHGPLANQVFCHAVDDGLRLGEAAKRMADRLVLAFLPARIHFNPASTTPERFTSEGAVMRRANGAGMIFYGDPALAPFRKNASHALHVEVEALPDGRARVTMGARPLLQGWAGVDFMVAESRLTDYYSVKTAKYEEELSAEVYRVFPLAAGGSGSPELRVVSARSGEKDVPAGEPQLAVEETPEGRLLHVRVPLKVKLAGTDWPQTLARGGVAVALEGRLGGR